jgi:hypothetical protein
VSKFITTVPFFLGLFVGYYGCKLIKLSLLTSTVLLSLWRCPTISALFPACVSLRRTNRFVNRPTSLPRYTSVCDVIDARLPHTVRPSCRLWAHSDDRESGDLAVPIPRVTADCELRWDQPQVVTRSRVVCMHLYGRVRRHEQLFRWQRPNCSFPVVRHLTVGFKLPETLRYFLRLSRRVIPHADTDRGIQLFVFSFVYLKILPDSLRWLLLLSTCPCYAAFGDKVMMGSITSSPRNGEPNQCYNQSFSDGRLFCMPSCLSFSCECSVAIVFIRFSCHLRALSTRSLGACTLRQYT